MMLLLVGNAEFLCARNLEHNRTARSIRPSDAGISAAFMLFQMFTTVA